MAIPEFLNKLVGNIKEMSERSKKTAILRFPLSPVKEVSRSIAQKLTKPPAQTGEEILSGLEKKGLIDLQAGKKTKELASDIIRATPRALGSTVLSVAGIKEIKPETTGQKILFGEKPVKSIKETGISTIKEFGGAEKTAQKFGPGLGLALTALDIVPGIGGKEKVASQIAKETKPSVIKGILTGIKELPADKIDDLSKKLVNTKTAKEVTRIINEAIPKIDDVAKNISKPEGLFGKLKSSIAPIKGVDDETKNIYTNWSRKNILAQETANQEITKIKIPEKEGFDTLLKYEQGEVTPYTDVIKNTFDDLFVEAKTRGLDIEKRINYLPQVYANTTEEIQIALARFLKDKGVPENDIIDYLMGKRELNIANIKALNLNPFFAKQRVFPDYKTAMEYGLRPRYTHPSQLVAHYRATLEKTLNNRELIDTLVKEGKILPAGFAPNHYEPIKLAFSPQGYYAEPKTAKLINGIFRNEEALGFGEEFFKLTAGLSKKAQEIALSAGVPKTDLNFFTFGQVIKEVTGGNLKAIVPLIRGNFDTATLKYFEDKAPVIKAMAEQGIDLGGRIGNYGSVYRNVTKNPNIVKALSEGAGETFDKWFNEKTFASFMPQLYIQTFDDALRKGLSKGMSEIDARKFAGDVTKNWMGLTDDLGRSKSTQDVLSSLFFAPKFRESLINSWANNIRAFSPKNLTNPSFYRNRRLVGGMILTYGLYNMLNKKLSGHYMWENPPGKEFDLQIPSGDDNVFVGFMPSYLAFARNMASGAIATVKGDLETATQKFGSLFSMPIKITSELISNRDYFGREIYGNDDSWPEKAKKMASYAGLAVSHPYISQTIKYLKGDKPLYQAISEGLELPLKFMSDEKITNNEFYEAMDMKSKERESLRNMVKPKYDDIQNISLEGKTDEAKARLSLLTDEEYEIYKDLKSSDKRKKTNAEKAKVYPKYKTVQELIKKGKTTEARAIVDGMTDAEYKAYKYLKNVFTEE